MTDDNEELDALVSNLRREEDFDAADTITNLRARVAELEQKVQGYYNEASDGWTKFRAAESQLQQVKADAERMTVHESWLAHRIEWLKSEAHKGGDWEYLKNKWDECAYVLEKFRGARRNDGTA